MTSGQGSDQPEGRGPAGQPPYGQPPAYGQPHGYGPMPSASAGPPPEPQERPVTVRAGIGALVGSLVLGVVASVVGLADIDALVRETVRVADDPAVTEETIRAGLVVGAVLALVLVAVQVLFLLFAWKGRNWARIVLWVLGGIGVLFGLVGALGGTAVAGDDFQASVSVFQLLLTGAGLLLLAARSSNEWYRSEKARRARR